MLFINNLHKQQKILKKNLDSGHSDRMLFFPSIGDIQTFEANSQLSVSFP